VSTITNGPEFGTQFDLTYTRTLSGDGFLKTDSDYRNPGVWLAGRTSNLPNFSPKYINLEFTRAGQYLGRQ